MNPPGRGSELVVQGDERVSEWDGRRRDRRTPSSCLQTRGKTKAEENLADEWSDGRGLVDRPKATPGPDQLNRYLSLSV